LAYVKRKLVNKLKTVARSHKSNIPQGEIEEDHKDRALSSVGRKTTLDDAEIP